MKPFRWAIPFLLLALSAPALRAQTAQPPKKEISEKTAGSLAQLRTLTEAKNYPAALALIKRLLAQASPDGFDTYVLVQVQTQILLTQGKYVAAIAPLETALRIGDAHPHFTEASARLEQFHLLAQLYYQRATEAQTPAAQKAGYKQALATLERWFKNSSRASADVRLFAAELLYQLGTLEGAGAPAGTGPDRIRQAITHAREGLLLSLRPADRLYQVLVAAHLQLGESDRAAELLELLAARDPGNAALWSQLQSIYLAEAKDPAQSRLRSLRALHVLDRAQAAGQLDTPKDHYTRIAILFNLQQFTRAADLLEKGLASGAIENSKRNWELLASAYQQTHREKQAIDALTRAAARFPEDAALEFSLAQLLYNTGRPAEAYARGQAAVAKGALEKPGQARIYLAYLAYELRRYDEAARWVEAARDSGGVPASTLDPLAAAINDALDATSPAAGR